MKKSPRSSRHLVSAWNPAEVPEMALPPCHYGFQVIVINDKLNLIWNQRSVDTALGLPFNIASYALLLHLLAKESGFKEGKLIELKDRSKEMEDKRGEFKKRYESGEPRKSIEDAFSLDMKLE